MLFLQWAVAVCSGDWREKWRIKSTFFFCLLLLYDDDDDDDDDYDDDDDDDDDDDSPWDGSLRSAGR